MDVIPNVCERCGYNPLQRTALKAHCNRKNVCKPQLSDIPIEDVIEIHWPQCKKPFQCETCDVRMTSAKNIKRHKTLCKHTKLHIMPVGEKKIKPLAIKRPLHPIQEGKPTGIVYMLQPPSLIGTDRYKIGCSANGGNVKRCLSYGVKSNVICICAVVNPFDVERQLKVAFNTNCERIAGLEYFRGESQTLQKLFMTVALGAM